MSLSPQFLDELRARTSLSALVGRAVKLQRAGREWKACCPFHKEKTPSFTLSDEKGFYHCFGCGAHGDAIRWLTDARGLPFMDAVKELVDAAGMEMPALDPSAQQKAQQAAGLYEVMEAAAAWYTEQLGGIEGATARSYLTERGITAATLTKFGFGYAPDGKGRLRNALKNFGNEKLIEAGLLIAPEDEREPYDRFRGRLMFPIRDQRGRVIAFSARILGAGEPKYLNSPDTPLFDKGRTLFNIDKAGVASRVAKRVVVVEGQMDVIALDQAGVSEAVAPLGTAVTEAQLQKLWQLADIPIFCFDGDAAGQKAAARAATRALPLLPPGKSLAFVTLPPGQDPDDLIKDSGKAGFEKEVGKTISLSELIWRHELQAEPLDTPEARAALGRRLRERAQTIANDDIRVQYLAFFNGQLGELFDRYKRNSAAARHHAFIRERSLSPELLAIARHGIDQAVIARAVLQGLRRHPNIIGQMAEAIALVWIKNKRWAQVRETMLAAALDTWPLERERLEQILKDEALAPNLQSLDKARDLAFSFLREGVEEAVAERDLCDVIEKVTAGASLDAATAKARRRLAEATISDWDVSWRELERLQELQRSSDDDLRSFWTHRDNEAEAARA
ncbi:MAG: primase [Alphaproteobacteria bacterium]|nr:primase [Alphaproteobacteria bacterium]